MAAIANSLKKVVGFVKESLMGDNPFVEMSDDPDYMNDGYEYVEEGGAIREIEPSSYVSTPIEKESKVINHPSLSKGGNEVVVVEPKAYNESITIVEALKERKTVILNLQLLDREQSQRIVDFLCGCTHALDGSQRKIGENVFIFTPSNINISQEFVNSKLSSDAMWTKA